MPVRKLLAEIAEADDQKVVDGLAVVLDEIVDDLRKAVETLTPGKRLRGSAPLEGKRHVELALSKAAARFNSHFSDVGSLHRFFAWILEWPTDGTSEWPKRMDEGSRNITTTSRLRDRILFCIQIAEEQIILAKYPEMRRAAAALVDALDTHWPRSNNDPVIEVRFTPLAREPTIVASPRDKEGKVAVVRKTGSGYVWQIGDNGPVHGPVPLEDAVVEVARAVLARSTETKLADLRTAMNAEKLVDLAVHERNLIVKQM